MRLTLKLRFHTRPGQSLCVTGDHPLLGGGDPARAVPLHYLNQEFWRTALEFTEASLKTPVSYDYLLRDADGTLIRDWGRDRRLEPAWLEEDSVTVVDSWNAAGFVENAFYTEPFQRVLLPVGEAQLHAAPPPRHSHTFKVKAPLLAPHQTVCLAGGAAALGHWSTAQPLLLRRVPGEMYFSAPVELAREPLPVEYKYGVFDCEKNAFVAWEAGPNRVLSDSAPPDGRVIVHDGFIRLPADTWRGAGVAVPVFSLRSARGFGVGEFTDLPRLVDWCVATGLKLIQILPVNDTTAAHRWTDSYPYAAISAFALHPLYLNLERVAVPAQRGLLRRLDGSRRHLNARAQVDYELVMHTKGQVVRLLFADQKRSVLRKAEFRAFVAANRPWLLPYAAFCFWRDEYGTADFNQWPEHRTFNLAEVEKLLRKPSRAQDEIHFHCFVQWHLHRQLKEAVAYAHQHGVILKGDLPIGVYRHGADTWQQPELYHLDAQAGAPPDPFADKGQNWGFPTYNWPRMAQDGFAWWRRRFAQMGEYFDALRIDHILGFFRIWTIPTHAVEGILGHFVPALPVKLEELAARGIPFDRARFTQPFITDTVLNDVFGADAGLVREQFLQPGGPGQYALRPEFATQRRVEAYFATRMHDERHARLRDGLYDLISNVLLLDAPGAEGREFHCRFFLDRTASFRALDPGTQAKLRELYVDYFFRRQDEFWRGEALGKLPALKRVTNMLICGEDLGLVPACVPEVMKALGLLSLEIQRMPKDPGRAFSRPAEAPYLSVVTPSTHDMSTLRGWWAEDRALTQRFYNEELGLPGAAPADCSGRINELIVEHHLASPAMWSIFQLQDWLGMDETLRHPDAAAERINVPANPRHYWRYRMHLTLEQLLASDAFNRRVRELVQKHGR